VVAALAVCVGVKEPQALPGAQLQVTPLFADSFEIVAAMVAVAPVCKDVGGAVLSLTEMAALLPPPFEPLLLAPPQPMIPKLNTRPMTSRCLRLIAFKRARKTKCCRTSANRGQAKLGNSPRPRKVSLMSYLPKFGLRF
jgi:hypothetical protein